MFEKLSKKIILNAGHYDDPKTEKIEDPGAVYNSKTEQEEVIKIRDLLVKFLEKDFDLEIVPDNLNLNESVKWVNKKVGKLDDALAVSIHLNASNGNGYGAETLYYGNSKDSKNLAKIILDEYCNKTKFKNRGVKSDTTTRFKSNGWIRNTNCWSTLIECYFLDNEDDLKIANNDDIAYAIYCGICKIYNIIPKEKKVSNEKMLDKLVKIKLELTEIFVILNDVIKEIRGTK